MIPQFTGQTQLCQFCNNLPSEDNITKGEKHNGHGPGRLLQPKPTKRPTKPAPGSQLYGFAPGKSNFLGLACGCCPYWTPKPTAAPTTPTLAPTTPTTPPTTPTTALVVEP
jgi:hypothetical protein